jgi:hypothetical protein
MFKLAGLIIFALREKAKLLVETENYTRKINNYCQFKTGTYRKGRLAGRL